VNWKVGDHLSLLVRKISRAKWPNVHTELKDFPGDVFVDLRTSNNELSVWSIDNIDELDKAIIALAVAPKNSSIENIDVVWVDEKLFEAARIPINNEFGDTAATAYRTLHRNIYGITYSSLGKVAEIISKSILEDNRRRIPKREVISIVKKAIDDGSVEKSECNVDLLQMLKI
jgi:hypothetical protein